MARRLLPYLVALVTVLGIGLLAVADPFESEGDQGEWSILYSPNRGGASDLQDVACPSPDLCIAVGNEHPDGKGFVELWDGSRWNRLGVLASEVQAVSCPSTAWCLAVGEASARIWTVKRNRGSSRPNRWRIAAGEAPVPPGASELKLRDASCTSPAVCTVAGIYSSAGSKTYVAWGRKGRWSWRSAVNPSGGVTYGMTGIDCPAVKYCVAVGTSSYRPSMEHWNGSRWKMMKAPSPAESTEVKVEAVSCAAPDTCMAVGNSRNADYEVSQPFAARWDGSRWSMARPPALSEAGYGTLRGISCVSEELCIAVGSVSYPFAEATRQKTVAMAWDGSEWSLQPTPSPRVFSSFAGVSCSSAGVCSAVGQTGGAGADWEHPPSSATLAARLRTG